MRVVKQEYQKELYNYKNQIVKVMIVENHEDDQRFYYSLDVNISKKKRYRNVIDFIQIPLYISEDFNEIKKRFDDLTIFKR